uniref:Uncharacterized protein n=1 Tax=Arundo donax TaxID=35708 RepID=A0A0A8YL60_ARUDO
MYKSASSENTGVMLAFVCLIKT